MNAKKDFHAKFIKIKKKLLILSLSYALKKKKKSDVNFQKFIEALFNQKMIYLGWICRFFFLLLTNVCIVGVNV